MIEQRLEYKTREDVQGWQDGAGGGWRIRTTEGVSQQIYSLPRLTAPETPHAPFLSI